MDENRFSAKVQKDDPYRVYGPAISQSNCRKSGRYQLSCNNNIKVHKVDPIKVTSVYAFSVHSEFNRNSMEIGICVQFFATKLPKIASFHRLRPLCSETFNNFVIVNMSKKVICKISIWYNARCLIF